jgi:outer membrane biosynthesis protein TonB
MKRLALILALMASTFASRAVAVDVSPPWGMLPDYEPQQVAGTQVVEVTFGADGTVTSCHVVRSTCGLKDDASIVAFIKANWKKPDAAGQTKLFPIVYKASAQEPVRHVDLPPPPDTLSARDPERKMMVRLTFGKDGWVDCVDLVQSSGSDALDRQTEIWIKVHWHSNAQAGKMVNVPFDFKPPPAEGKQ